MVFRFISIKNSTNACFCVYLIKSLGKLVESAIAVSEKNGGNGTKKNVPL
jgi:hypothetical protein